jgi:hypothetical protein
VESLARGGPWRLGAVRRGQSTWRTLSEVDTKIYGGSSRRRLYGCVCTMFPVQARPPESGTESVVRELAAIEQQLLTWSQVSKPLH